MRHPIHSAILPLAQRALGIHGAGLLVRAAFRRLALASERYRQRRHLEALDDHQLADIGLTRRDVARECAKPFWSA